MRGAEHRPGPARLDNASKANAVFADQRPRYPGRRGTVAVMGETVGISGSRERDTPAGVTDEMKLFVDVLKRELNEEFRIAERLDAKARGYLTSATVAAAAAQAAAIAFIAQVGVSQPSWPDCSPPLFS